MSYAQVQAAVPESENIVSDTPVDARHLTDRTALGGDRVSLRRAARRRVAEEVLARADADGASTSVACDQTTCPRPS